MVGRTARRHADPRTGAALAQRLPRSSVVGADTAIRVTPDATVEISIQRLDANRDGAVTLVAQIAVGYRSGRRDARRAVL